MSVYWTAIKYAHCCTALKIELHCLSFFICHSSVDIVELCCSSDLLDVFISVRLVESISTEFLIKLFGHGSISVLLEN